MPGINFGAAAPDRIYVGSDQINKIYHGPQQVWPAFDTPSGPAGCWVPVFQTVVGQPAAHPELCQTDLGILGNVIQIDATGQPNTPDIAGPFTYGFENRVHASGYGNVSADVLNVPSGSPSTGYYLATLTGEDFFGVDRIDSIEMVIRNGNLGSSGDIMQLDDDVYNDGYIGAWVSSELFGPKLAIIKPSVGTRSSAVTLSLDATQIEQNHTVLDIFINPPTPTGQSSDEIIASEISSYFIGKYLSLGFFTNLNVIHDFVYIDDYSIDGSEASPALFYGRQWTTYGTGESARFLMNRSTGDNIAASSGNSTILSHLHDVPAHSQLALGSNEINSDITINRIRYSISQRRLILNRSGGGHFGDWAAGDGVGKSLFVACRGDIMELPFNATSERPADANPNTEEGGGGYFRWDLRTTTDGANAMHDHIVDYLDGTGYQMLFIVADQGSVRAIPAAS